MSNNNNIQGDRNNNNIQNRQNENEEVNENEFNRYIQQGEGLRRRANNNQLQNPGNPQIVYVRAPRSPNTIFSWAAYACTLVAFTTPFWHSFIQGQTGGVTGVAIVDAAWGHFQTGVNFYLTFLIMIFFFFIAAINMTIHCCWTRS